MSHTPIDLDLRAAMSKHDTSSPATPEELRTLASEMEDALVQSESQFSHPDWRYVDGLRALAASLAAASGERLRDSERLDWLEANRDDLIIQQQVDHRSDGMPWRIYDCRRHCSEYGRTLAEAIGAARAARSSQGDAE